jgi:hypothetical protein
VAPDATGRADAVRRAGEGGPGDDQLPRDDPLANDLAIVIDVVDEQVERAHALREPTLDHAPLVAAQDARDQVEREGPVAGRAVGAARVEGDALLDEDRVAPDAGGLQAVAPEPAKRRGERLRRAARTAGRLEQLVVEARRGLVWRARAQAP